MKKNKEISSNENQKLFNRVELKESLNIADLPNYLEKITENIKNIEKRMSKKELDTQGVSDFLLKGMEPKNDEEIQTNNNIDNGRNQFLKKVSISPSKVEDINDIVKKSIIGVNEVLKNNNIVKQYEEKFTNDFPFNEDDSGIGKTVEPKRSLFKKNNRVNNLKKRKRLSNKSAIVDRPNSSFDINLNDLTRDKINDNEKNNDKSKEPGKVKNIKKSDKYLDKLSTEPIQNKKIVKKINYNDKPKSSRGRLSDYHKCSLIYKNNNPIFSKENNSPLNLSKKDVNITEKESKNDKIVSNNRLRNNDIKIDNNKLERQSRSQIPSRNKSCKKFASINTEEVEKKISELIPILDNDLIIKELPTMEDKPTEKKLFKRINTPGHRFEVVNNISITSQNQKQKGSVNKNQKNKPNHTPNNHIKNQANVNLGRNNGTNPTTKRPSIKVSKNLSVSRDDTQNNSSSKIKDLSQKNSKNKYMNRRSRIVKTEGGEDVDNTKKNLNKLFEREGKRKNNDKQYKEQNAENKEIKENEENTSEEKENITEKIINKEEKINRKQCIKLTKNKEVDNLYKVNFPENIETKDIFSLMLLWNELILDKYSKKFSNANKKILSNYSNVLSKFILCSFSNEDENEIKVRKDENKSAIKIQKFWRNYKMRKLIKNKSMKSEIRKTIFSRLAEKEGFQLNKINLLFNSVLYTYGEMKNKDEMIYDLIQNNNSNISQLNQQQLYKNFISYSLQQQNQNFVLQKKDIKNKK